MGRNAIGRELVRFYQTLFTSNNPIIPDDLENLIELLITYEDNELLTSIPDEHDIYATLKKMHPEKASGLDGMTINFFSYFLEVVRMDVVCTIQNFF